MLLNCIILVALSRTAHDRQVFHTLDAIPNKSWEATDASRIAQMSPEDFRSMLVDMQHAKPRTYSPAHDLADYEDAPDEYDYRDAHPQCVGHVFDQGRCGSCWAFASTSAFSDRRCVAGLTNTSWILSAQYLLSCDIVNKGCDGGFIVYAWDFFRTTGVPTFGCVSYTDEAYFGSVTTECPKTCDSGKNIIHIKVSEKAKDVGGDPERIKAAIYTDGPVVTLFSVYRDFQHYKRGIYKHHTGDELGGHSVEIVGYGSKGGIDFWRARNSWGDDWGEDGFFRIVRGANECGFEEIVVSGHV